MTVSEPRPSPDGVPNSARLESSLAPEPVRAVPFVFWSLAFAAGIFADTVCLIDIKISLSAAVLCFAVASKRRESPVSSSAAVRAVILSCLPFAFVGAAANARFVRYFPPGHIATIETGAVGQPVPSLLCDVIDSDRNPTVRERERDSQWRSLVVDVINVGERKTRGLALLTIRCDGESPLLSDIQIGDQLRIADAPLTELSAPPDERLRDRRPWLLRRGISRRIRASDSAVTSVEPPALRSPLAALKRLRNQLATSVADSMRPDDAALFNAFILGYKKDVDGNLYEIFRRTGTAHLLAISGLHLHLFALLVWAAGRRFSLSRERLAAVVLAVSFSYGALTGFQPPVARAFIMLAVHLGGIIIRRDSTTINSVGLAALILLIASPAQLFDAGFQLSFAAVCGIILLSPVWQELLWGRERVWAPEAASISDRIRFGVSHAGSASFSAWLATAPIVGLNFGSVAPFAPIANILVIPVSAIVQATGILWLAATLILPSGAPEFITAIASLAVWLLRVWIETLGAVLASRAAAPDLPTGFAVSAVAFVFLSGWNARRGGRYSSPGFQSLAAAVLLVPSLFPGPTAPEITVIRPSEKPTLIIIDGDGGATVIDPGSSRRADDVAEILRVSGVRRINALIISRSATADPDGASALLDLFPARRVILPPATKIDSAHRIRLLDKLKSRGIEFRVLGESQPSEDSVRRTEFTGSDGARGYRLAITTAVCDIGIHVRMTPCADGSKPVHQRADDAQTDRTVLELEYARRRSSYRVTNLTIRSLRGERLFYPGWRGHLRNEPDEEIIRVPIQ